MSRIWPHFLPALPEFEPGAGKPLHPSQRIIGLIDDSGSTDNSASGGRGGGEGREIAGPPVATREEARARRAAATAPILVAETEGFYEVLAALSRKYNLCGTALSIFAFSSGGARPLFPGTMTIGADQEAELAIVCANHPVAHAAPMFAGTELVVALQSLPESLCGAPCDLIIASDGRTSDERGEVTAKSVIASRFPGARLFAIGAGSISGSCGGAQIVFGRSGCDLVPLVETEGGRGLRPAAPAAPAAGSLNAAAPSFGYAECDVSFFTGLCTAARTAIYAPAFRDYAALRLAAEHLIENSASEGGLFAVVLDGALGNLDEKVCALLSALPETPADRLPTQGVAFATAAGNYVIASGNDGGLFQLAVGAFTAAGDQQPFTAVLEHWPATYNAAGSMSRPALMPQAGGAAALLTPCGRWLRVRPIVAVPAFSGRP